MSLTNREKAVLDRYLTSTPYDTEFSSTERRGAVAVPDREIARALRQQIHITWKHLHEARRERDAFRVVALRAPTLAYYGGRDLRYEENAIELRTVLLALLDIWASARRAVRR